MSIEVYKQSSRLAEQVVLVGVDYNVLEFALYALGEIGDGDFGLASSMACDVLDEVEARVSEARASKGGLSLVKAQPSQREESDRGTA